MEDRYMTYRVLKEQGPRIAVIGGGHGLSGYDWNWMLDFADSVFAAGRCRN
jgi:hypothetical protein